MFRSLIPFGRRGELAGTEDSFSSMQREMNRMFGEAFRGYVPGGSGKALLAPSMDVRETDKSIEIEAELPGVDEKDVQVTLEGGVLTVKGEKRAEKDETKGGYHISERSYGSFLRSLDLPNGIDVDKASANFSKGVLKVTLPKVPEAQSRAKKIEVKASK